MWWAMLIFTLLLLAMTLAPHLPGQHWTIRVWEFPRVQILSLMVINVVGWLWWWNDQPLVATVCIGLLAAAIAYQAFWILPYTPLWSSQVRRVAEDKVDRSAQISILNSNVYMHNDNYEELLRLIREKSPDMVVTLESDGDWQKALQPIHDDYPYRLLCPLDNLYGMHLYSRLPLEQEQLSFLIEDDIPSMQVRVSVAGQTVQIYCLHPKPPSPTENESAQPRDSELLLVGKKMSDCAEPVIVTGDLNDVAWSPSTRRFRKISGAQDPRIGRGFFNTFHAGYRLLRWPLDHIFHSRHFELVAIERLRSIGSDHFPLMATLQLKKTDSHT